MNKIHPYKNRILEINKHVLIYRNLHNKLLSVKQKNIIGHTDLIILKNIEFIIHNAAYNRTIKEKSRNVHAFVKGYVLSDTISFDNATQIFYNPFKSNYFMTEHGEKIVAADYAKISSDGKMFVVNPVFN